MGGKGLIQGLGALWGGFRARVRRSGRGVSDVGLCPKRTSEKPHGRQHGEADSWALALVPKLMQTVPSRPSSFWRGREDAGAA